MADGRKAPSSGGIPRVPQAPHYALSHGQKRLWVLDQVTPGSAVYGIPAAYRLEGELNTAHLAAALTALVARHESLR